MSVRTVFLDKDGTLIQNVPYNVDPQKISFMPHATEGIEQLAQEGFHFVIVSNQPGVALGKFALEDLEPVRHKLHSMMHALGADLLGFYYCPHDDKNQCACRKPSSGMIERAIEEHDIDVDTSWLVGDILDDIEAGNRAGLQTIFLNNGNETQWQQGRWRVPDAIAGDLNEAALRILQ